MVPTSGHCGLVHRTLWEVSYRRCPARRFDRQK